MNPAEIGYVAGILDGEGSIMFNFHEKGNSVWMSPKITVITTDSKLAYFLCKTFGGTVARYQMNKWHRGDAYHWIMRRPLDIRGFLITVGPYLIVKARHKDLMLKWFEIREDRRNGHSKPSSIPEKELDIARRIRDLNKKQNRLAPNSLSNRLLGPIDKSKFDFATRIQE